MQLSYPESASPLITTLFISYLVAFHFGCFWNFCGFHQDSHTAVRSKPNHPPSPPPQGTHCCKNMTFTTVIIIQYLFCCMWNLFSGKTWPQLYKRWITIHWINLYPLDRDSSIALSNVWTTRARTIILV